jgi:tetratricopeptide (TPR) repeat protein
MHSVFSEIRLAQFLVQRGQLDEALRVLETIDRDAEGSSASKVALGDFYAKQANWEEAASFYQAALDLDPAFTEAAIGLAYVQHMLGKPEKAVQVYNSMVQVSPDNPELHLAISDSELDAGISMKQE